MAVSATQLRQNIYAILDEALATGQPVEIERKGQVLRIIPETAQETDKEAHPKLARLKDRGLLVGNLADFDHIDWSHEWSELKK